MKIWCLFNNIFGLMQFDRNLLAKTNKTETKQIFYITIDDKKNKCWHTNKTEYKVPFFLKSLAHLTDEYHYSEKKCKYSQTISYNCSISQTSVKIMLQKQWS